MVYLGTYRQKGQAACKFKALCTNDILNASYNKLTICFIVRPHTFMDANCNAWYSDSVRLSVRRKLILW